MNTWIEIQQQSIQHNYKTFQDLCSPADVVPVIKSNAYGHGYSETFQALAPTKPKIIAANYTHEAQFLRKLGHKGRILLVGPIMPDEWPIVRQVEAEAFIANYDSLTAWLALEDKPRFHLKINTGMNRQGFRLEQCDTVALKLKPHLKYMVGLASHFANVEDVLEHTFARAQLDIFNKAREKFTNDYESHIASSASAILMKCSHFDYTRVGISLYGIWPSKSTRLSAFKIHDHVPDLIPALSWYTTVTQVQKVLKDDYIGYGCTFKAPHEMNIAVLPVGYNEGYPRAASDHHSYVLIKGQRARIVGRICMNMMMVDVTDIQNVQQNDRVTLIGSDGQEAITAETMADWAGTINYEILTRLPAFIPRKLI